MKYIIEVPANLPDVEIRRVLQENESPRIVKYPEIEELPKSNTIQVTFTREQIVIFVTALLNEKRKIEAIKLLRSYVDGLGLREAKDMVDNWDRGEAEFSPKDLEYDYSFEGPKE